jgi:hypothetical protein
MPGLLELHRGELKMMPFEGSLFSVDQDNL